MTCTTPVGVFHVSSPGSRRRRREFLGSWASRVQRYRSRCTYFIFINICIISSHHMVCVRVHDDDDTCAGGRTESCVPDGRSAEESEGKKNRVRLSRGTTDYTTTTTTATSGETQISYEKQRRHARGGGGGEGAHADKQITKFN